MTATIRSATPEDFPEILRLNDEWVRFTSPLDRAALAALDAQSPYHRIIELDGRVVAFLLALRDGADYTSPNYVWFAQRGGAFLYVDRVIVDASAQGMGLARRLYEDLIAFARAAGTDRIVCELDIEPPNAASGAFHDSFGFVEVGTQLVAGGTKRVSLRELRLR